MSPDFDNKYILPSPAGAFYCVSSSDSDSAKTFLQQLMLQENSLQLDKRTLDQLLHDSETINEDVLFYLQDLNWLQGFDQEQSITKGTIEEILPDILKLLSSKGEAILADNQGFYLAGTGFTHEASEELSALSGDLLSLYTRHQGIIKGNLKINSSAFALVDAAGYSQLGFWPINIGKVAFMLVISGVPHFDQDAFVKLIWMLHKRYFISTVEANKNTA